MGVRRRFLCGQPNRSLREPRNRGPRQHPRRAPRGRGLGRRERESLAVWRRRMDDVGTPNGILNDLWVYNISSNQWTWVHGREPVTNSTRANHNGVYPSQPVIGPVNTTGAASTCGLPSGLTVNSQVLCSAVDTTGALPGSRWGAAGWIDAAGNLWLFGGWGLDSKATNGNGALDDLWVYTPNSTVGQPGTWAWVKGSNTGSQNGIYGDKVIPYKTFVQWTPGGRSNATHWIDTRGQLWMFGGEGYDSTSTIRKRLSQRPVALPCPIKDN